MTTSRVRNKGAAVVVGGSGDKSKGYYINPTLIVTKGPRFITMEEEIFGSVVTEYIYDDHAYESTLELCGQTSPYGLTGPIIAKDRRVVAIAKKNYPIRPAIFTLTTNLVGPLSDNNRLAGPGLLAQTAKPVVILTCHAGQPTAQSGGIFLRPLISGMPSWMKPSLTNR